MRLWSQKFWLCDLAGTVNISNNPGTLTGQSVFDIVPVRQLNFIFDALVFNACFHKSSGRPVYIQFTKTDGSVTTNSKQRAFLRMKVLLGRVNVMFEEGDSELGKLRFYAMGDRNPGN